ncbi:hypothetical protein [Ralstonia phage RSP15]|uniref:hypothetical protein n=1 Tax=Ralstonia phage RSP15 TaxID=1785960 RepID=UPI00074D44A8|nr:hypothetical protein BH754_gp115 [Ralstonia phage RSP15]BAU40191.1 hypothetical protein [Ralstonia phage RSP15]
MLIAAGKSAKMEVSIQEATSSKYRIVDSGKGYFIVQEKGWFFWRDYTVDVPDGYVFGGTYRVVCKFYSLESAKNQIKKLLKEQEYPKVVWEI